MVTYKITARDTLVTGLITLIAVYFTYYLEYKDVFLALTFLQEKLTNTPVSIAPKHTTTTYSVQSPDLNKRCPQLNSLKPKSK